MLAPVRSMVVCLVLLLLVAACGEEGEPVATRPSTSAAPASTTVEPTTTEAPTPTTSFPVPLSDESRLGFHALGPVTAGMTVEQVKEAADVPMVSIELPACRALATEADPRGVEFLFPGRGALEFLFVREQSPIRSESGIAIGDTEATVLAAHPDAEVINPEVEVHRVVVREPGERGRRLIYEIDRGRVLVMWSGPFGSEQADEVCS